jgi:hypothetical protein
VKVIGLSDIVIAARFLVGLPISWLFPVKSWPSICKLAARAHVFVKPRHKNLENFLGENRNEFTAHDLQVAWRQHKYLSYLELLREYRTGGWHPALHIDGLENLRNGLDRGKGVVLWIAPLEHSGLVFKKALF